MVKQKLKKLLALALSILMLSSNFTELLPHAQAAEPEPQAVTDTGVKDQFRDDANGRPNLFVDFLGDNYDYRADNVETRALGTLIAPAGYDKSVRTNGEVDQDVTRNKWDRYIEGDINTTTANQIIFWVGVGIDRKEVFKLLEGGQGLTSFEGGFYYDANVIEPYIDPKYIPAGQENDEEALRAAYLRTISDANINNTSYPANTQWSDKYEILRAETGLSPTTDPITQEELKDPSIDQILTGQYNDGHERDWKMTYVSLELKDIATPANQRRLANVYTGPTTDANGNPVTLKKAQGTGLEAGEAQIESDYQYLLLMPFRLKSYGGEDRLHLRLLRNATHFSIGAGTYGVDPYGAWERVTTRNPGKDLKLLTNFTGDLYLFGAHPKAEEVLYDAMLEIINGGGAENTAKLMVDGDPAIWPVWADTDGDYIYGLQSGTGMKLDVHAQIGYTATVTVTYNRYIPGTTTTEKVSHEYITVATGQDSQYTFVMPKFEPVGTVTVTVTFQHENRETFRIYLSDIPQPNDPDYKIGNETTITTNLDAALATTAKTGAINTFDPVVTHPNTSHSGITHADGPAGDCDKDQYVRIHVDTHADYEAEVHIYSFLNKEFTTNFNGWTVTAPSYMIDNTPTLGLDSDNKPIPNPHYNTITLPSGGDITFQMSESDIDVEVKYQKAARHKATLEVYHTTTDTPVLDTNVAQLAYLAYDDANVPATVYSGVVYEDYVEAPFKDDHRAVKDPTRRLDWVSRSAATLSGSLGGDTERLGKEWNPNDLDSPLDPVIGAGTVMALLASAPDLTTFRTQINGLDLSTTVITKDGGGNATLTGFRKDLYGALYSDADIAGFADILWELRQRIESSPSLQSAYKKQVQMSATDPTVAYVYYDLTPAQVQDYLLTVFQNEKANNANQSGYRTTYLAYLTAKQLYDKLEPLAAYNGLLPKFIAPEVPRQVSVNTSYERVYEDPFYHNIYLNSYDIYIREYQAYLEQAEALGAPPAVSAALQTAINNVDPDRQTLLTPFTVPLNAAHTAQNNVAAMTTGNKWETTIIKPDATPSEDDDPAVPAHTIYTREGRTVWVVLEADSEYTVRGVELYERLSDGSAGAPLATTVTPAPVLADGYQNVYSFTMPEEDCVVRVTYGLRDTRKLNITYTGADGETRNNAKVEAYRVATNPRDTKPKYEFRTNKDDLNTDPYVAAPIEQVFVGSTVTITVDVDDDYDVELHAVNRNNSTDIQIIAPDGGRDGVYTFVIPGTISGDVDLTIAYTPKEQPKNWAVINAITPSDVTGDARNTAFWREGGLFHRLTDVPQGTLLTGEITVAPGYYIYSVTAYGDSGNYPYTLTGNGYNGGYGTSMTGTSVPINVFVNMPGENLTVDVVFRQGIPDPDPANTLTLTVKDDDNLGPDTFAPNWAKAEVYDSREDYEAKKNAEQNLPTIGDLPGDVVGKNASFGNQTLSDRKYVDAGKWVKVDFHNHVVKKADGTVDTAQSYYVSKVSVGPQHLGVSLVWEDDHSVSFYMPAGSTGVTVEFSKYPENGRLPNYFLTVQETYRDLNSTPTTITQTDYDNNYVTFADSATIQSWNHAPISLHPYNETTGEHNPERLPDTTQTGATGVAEAGEEVTMTFIADESNWYVQSVVVISDGAAYRGTFTDVTPAGTTGSKKTYEATFRMPTGDAEFIVHYRRGPKPDTPDYAFTLTLTDDDNEPKEDGTYDDNRIVASFVDASGLNAAGHADLPVGHTVGTMTDVRHVHAGDTVTLTVTLQPDYTLEYLLVNPSRLKIYPVWTSTVTDPVTNVTTMTANFTMPTEGVAAVARIVKGDPQKYTANLILHPPEGMTSMDGVGQGTFALPSGGSLTNYPQNAVFSTYAVPGTTLPYDLYAFDGYYIDRITVNPELGVTGTLSGAFGYQDGEVVMPAANINVNVWFKKGWPDEVKYRLTLEVFGAGYQVGATDNNYANFTQIIHTDAGGATVLSTPDNDPVYSGQRKHLRPEEGVAFDRDTVYVGIFKNSRSYVDASSIQITDSIGNTINWWYAPGGIAFTMPPRSTTVRITFRPGQAPEREAQLHILGEAGGDAAVLTAASASAVGSPADADGDTISKLIAGDTLTLNVTPDAARHVTAAYAVNRTTGEIIPLTKLDADGVRVRAELVYSGGEGEFAMPEANVDVYVRFAAGTIDVDDLPLKLVVSGAADSGSATAEVTAPAANKKDMTVAAPGMDTRFTKVGDTIVATFEPNEADKYAITKLEVYDEDGNPVSYEWISVVQDPENLIDPDMWPGTAPDNIASHPTWKPNDKLQITFPMPGKGVTIHVTYDKIDTSKEYTAQVVVNDSAYNDLPTPSRNNAWLRNQVIDNIQRKIQTAHPGEWIDLDITVHPGYRVEYIKVVPQSYGIVPGLPLGPFYSQNTGFRMPAGNVTVYVKFADDGLEERNATLVVTGTPTGDAANYAVISSPRSGDSAPVLVGGAPQTVIARPDMDWVSTDYYWNTNGTAYIKKITVTTASGAAVPFTQLEDPATGHGTITFPMVDDNVTVRVEYTTDRPIGEEIYLHVIDATVDPESSIGANARASMSYPFTGTPEWNASAEPWRRDATNPWGHTIGAYHAPAGQKVRLVTNAMSGVYLQSAYVLYADVGQMVNLTTASTGQGDEFVVHPGRNDVYVTFTKTKPDPDEHAAILMLRAPENNAGRASIAANDVYDGPAVTDQDRLNEANVGHAKVVAKEGNRIIIQVAPAEGYVIESVLVTPLGFPLKTQAVYNYTQVGNTISFDMPHRDIAITVTLKRGSNQFYDVNLHYVKDTIPATAPAIQDINYAQLAWTDAGVNNTIQADEDPATTMGNVTTTQIREGTNVTLTGHLGGAPTDPDHPDTILSAFVLRNGTLVSLTPPLEGKEATNGAPTDHNAAFTMPAGDVDVFLVVTTDPPENPWHTAVLVVTDTSPNGNDIGENTGYLWKNNDTAGRKSTKTSNHNMGYTWMAVEEGDTFAVQPEANAGYAFVPPATLSCNDGAHGGNMYAESTSPYVYRDTMGTCNKAALISFVSDEALKLTVVIRDPENPSDGSTFNKLLTQQPTAATPVPDLALTSTNVGGAYQIMEGVTPGEPILLTATPAPGFTATAQIHYFDGSVADIPLTLQGNGALTGSIPMPTNNATIIVTFHGDYTGTLTLWDLSASDKTAQATMKEDTGTAPDQVTVNHLGTSDSLTHLPTGTKLTANMIKNDNLVNKTVTALLKRNGYTTLMSPAGQNAEGMDEYIHTINRADAEIIMVVRDKTSKTYVAAVNTINKPALDDNGDPVADPTITATPAGAASGAIWTTADENNTVTVTFPVPEGYQAIVTASHGNVPTGTFTADDTVTFTMPATDVQVTIEYRRTEYELTLRVIAPVGTSHTTAVDTTDYEGTPVTLTQDYDVEWVKPTTPVTLTDATPNTAGLVLLSASYTAADGSAGFLDVGDSFTMPAADTVVTVRYAAESPPPEEDTYIALVEVVDKTTNPGTHPGNKATTLANTTTSGLNGLSPHWWEGLQGDAIRVTYEIEPDCTAVVTAYRRGDPSMLLPIAVVSSPSNGVGTVTMPGGTDIIIRICYYDKTDPPTGDVILQLVAHGTQVGNAAEITSPGYNPALGLLATNGTAPAASTTTTNAHYITTGDATSPVETDPVSTSTMGNELRVYAKWAANYQVVRMTIATRDTATGVETPEVTITRSTYGSATTGRTLMPGLGTGEVAVVRVYYGNIFEATLHVVGATDNDETHATDNRGVGTVTSTGSNPIYNTGDKLLDFMGNNGEIVQTTAIPDTANGKRLVGVVWESKTTGAASADPNQPNAADPTVSDNGQYDFEMPADDVDFYAVYEPDDPDNRHYIAKVNFEGTAHLGSAQNAVTITNASDPTASHGNYWTAAKEGETVTVNVKVAPGYKALVTRTYKDHETTHTPPYDFYINRTAFVPNLVLGKDATFTMPANTDATVTIQYIKGYDLSLEVADTSNMADAANHNQADVTAGTVGTLRGYTDDAVDGSGNRIPHYTPDPAVVKPVDGGTDIDTTVTPVNDGTKDAPYKVFYSTAFSGTVRVDNPQTANHEYNYKMPSADTVESVIFYNDETPLLAKVELKGESDINGNKATPIKDYTDTTSPDGGTTPAANKTVTGTVWTTTTHATNEADAHTIDLTLTVAKGYVAKITVRRDNDNYYNNLNDPTKWDYLDATQFEFRHVTTTLDTDGTTPITPPPVALPGEYEVQIGYQDGYQPPSAFPADISGEQHFRFRMVDASNKDENGDPIDVTDVTVIVEFVFAGDIPQPFDPDNMKMDKIDLERGFIYGENRGDFALIDIPTLEKDKELFDTDNYDKPAGGNKDVQKAVKYSFFLYDADKDEYTPLTLGTDILLEPEDEDTLRQPTDPYNYYDYKTKRATGGDILDDNEAVNAEKTYTGSRFKLIPTDPDKTTQKRTAGAQAVYEMLNNQGSLEAYQEGGDTKYRTTLYVIAEDAIGQKSAYTQVWIRPHFTIEIGVISYAPNHTTTASVYKLMTQEELDKASGYADDNTQPQVTQDAREFRHYRWNDDAKPYLSNETFYEDAALSTSKYYQKVSVMSSELLGGYDHTYDPGADSLLRNVLPNTEAHYALTVEKASDLTYTRVDLDLMPKPEFGFDLDSLTFPKYYNDATLTYTVADIVHLITGDVDGNGMTKWTDYDTVYSYVYRNIPWNNTQTEAPKAGDPQYAAKLSAWMLSTYNPDSMAYRCDLNGDRMVNVQDLNLVQTVFDYNRSEDDYRWKTIADGSWVLPFGFGSVKDDPNYSFDLFALRWDDEPIPVEPDPYWDSLVDPETTVAVPMDTVYVDEDGALWSDPVRLENSSGLMGGENRPAHPDEGDPIPAIPGGEEIMDAPADLPDVGERVELPDLPVELPPDLPLTGPEDDLDLPLDDDTGPSGELPATPADTMTEE